MLVIWGKALHGSFREGAGTRIATVFHHLWYVPLLPERSVVLLHVPGGEELMLPLPRYHRLSLLLGWSPVLFPALSLVLAIPLALLVGTYALAIVIAFAFAAAAWLHLRHQRFIGDDEDWQRRVRSGWLGAPIDVSMPLFDQDKVEPPVRAFLEAHLRAHPLDYRTANVEDGQTAAALDDRMVDIDFLIAAATLAELVAPRTDKPSAAGPIWEKALRLCPALREAPAFYGLFGIEGAFPVYKPKPSAWSRVGGTLALASASLAALLAAGFTYHETRHPRFALVSPIGANVEVEIDGVAVREPFKQALGQGEWLDLKLEAGRHVVTVRREGRVIDERPVEIDAGAKGYVFVANGSTQHWCVFRETVQYGSANKAAKGPVLVAHAGETVKLEQAVDVWFSEPPRTVSSKSSSTRDVLFLSVCDPRL